MLKRTLLEKLTLLLLAFILVLTGLGIDPATPARALNDIHYVIGAACTSAPCDGTSWAKAFPTLQDALAVAVSGDQVWVKAGVYYPDEGAGQVNNSRSSSFNLITGVAIYGGFAGTETQLSQRNITTNVTILSGDIDKNDTNGDGNNVAEVYTHIQGNNAYHVVSNLGLTSVDSTAILDGFTITAGKADGGVLQSDTLGGGIRLMSGKTPTLSNLTVIGNDALANGGGMYASESSNAALNNVNFTGNNANNGGGLYFDDTDIVIIISEFFANTADNGGGMSVVGGSSPTLSNLTFFQNEAGSSGGGMVISNSTPSLTDAIFQENDAPLGGGLYASPGSNSILTRVTFRQNTAMFGGGIYMVGSTGNYAYLLATNSTFSGNTASSNGGGIHSSMGDVSLTNGTFSDNSASGSGGGLYTDNMSAAYFRNTIVANSTGGDCLSLNGSGGSSVNSLFEDAVNTCSAVNGANGNITGVDPLLGSFQTFGITGTHPLLANSPAINTGTNSGCPATDQRGVTRPQGGTCDMGAFEKEILSLTLQSVGANDGYLRESTETSNLGGYANSSATIFYAGDDAANRQYRGLLHFNTAPLPDNAVITRVTLKIRKQAHVGTDPFTILGNLSVDMRRPTFGVLGVTNGDFQVTAGRSAVAVFGAPLSNWYSAVLNSSGRLYLNLTGTTEFRLAFTTDDNNNLVSDAVKFFSGNHTNPAVRPQLIVEYYVP